MATTKSGTPDREHKTLLLHFRFWKLFEPFVMLQPLKQPFVIVINDSFCIISPYSIKKWFIRISHIQYCTLLKTSDSLTFTDFMKNPFIFHLANFTKTFCYLYNTDTTYLKHDTDTFMWVLSTLL